MSGLNFKRLGIGAIATVVIFLAGASDASAQSRREIERERQRIERENARYQRNVRRNRSGSVTRRQEQQINNSTYASGYEQGLLAGQYDRRRGKYNQSNVYRNTGSYPNAGDPTSMDYIYRQGYLQGYEDGYQRPRNF